MISQKKPHEICTRVYSQEIGPATLNYIKSTNMSPLQIQKVAKPPASWELVLLHH